MLILSRKKGEGIRIADTVEVTVLAISNSRVKLGFSAPPDIWLRRNELPVVVSESSGAGKPMGSDAVEVDSALNAKSAAPTTDGT